MEICVEFKSYSLSLSNGHCINLISTYVIKCNKVLSWSSLTYHNPPSLKRVSVVNVRVLIGSVKKWIFHLI